MKMEDVPADRQTLQRIKHLGLDEFERGVLHIARYFLEAHEAPETQSWHRAFLIAVECWGEPVGLSAAHALSKYAKAILRFRSDGLVFHDPLSEDAREFATDDEALTMAVLHYMRRDQTNYARDAVAALTHGQMDPDVIRTALSFANRFSAGEQPRRPQGRTPELRLVV